MQNQLQQSIPAPQQEVFKGRVLQKRNNTGLPDQLKNGVEVLSGHSMDDVKVHYNSPKPATLQAHAYAQGNQIHLGPGQEKHLAHEAWHVVQQKQGRVKPTLQAKGGTMINDNTKLEREADVMGRKANGDYPPTTQLKTNPIANTVIQRKVGLEFQTHGGKRNVTKLVNGIEEDTEPKEVIWDETKHGYKIEADGTDLEYVLTAIDLDKSEKLDGLDKNNKLVNAARHASERHKIFTSIKNKDTRLKISGKNIEYLIHGNGTETAHPQATMGVRLESIFSLINRISTPIKLLQNNLKPNDQISAYNQIGYGGTVSYYVPPKNKDSYYINRALLISETRQKDQQETLNQIALKVNNSKSTNKTKGMLTLILQYIEIGKHLLENEGSVANAKNAMPVMSRTSLHHFWSDLKLEEQEFIVDYLKKTYSGLDINIAYQNNVDGEIGLKLEDWLKKLDGKEVFDSMSGKFHGVSSLSAYGPAHEGNSAKERREDLLNSYGISPKNPLDIGHSDNIQGIIVELRALGRNIKPEDWPKVAQAVCVITQHLNQEPTASTKVAKRKTNSRINPLTNRLPKT